MSLFFTAIVKQREIICCKSVVTFDFVPIIKEVIGKIVLQTESVSLVSNDFCIHYKIADMTVFICVSDFDFDRSRAFLCLQKLQRKWSRANENKFRRRSFISEMEHTMLKYMDNYATEDKQGVRKKSSIDLRDKKIRKLSDLNIKIHRRPQQMILVDRPTTSSSQVINDEWRPLLRAEFRDRSESGLLVVRMRSLWTRHKCIITFMAATVFVLLLIAVSVVSCCYSRFC